MKLPTTVLNVLLCFVWKEGKIIKSVQHEDTLMCGTKILNVVLKIQKKCKFGIILKLVLISLIWFECFRKQLMNYSISIL